MDQLLIGIDFDYSSAPIKDLWQCADDVISFLSPESALPLGDIDFKFDIMISSESTLFQMIWKKQVESAAASIEKLSLQDIRTVLWEYSFKECNDLLDSLNDRSIMLSEVEKYMRPVEDNIRGELEKLSTSLHKCVDSDQENKFNLDGVVQHINDLWSLLILTEEARAVMELKEKLSLHGDFNTVLTLTNQVLLGRLSLYAWS